MHGVMLWWPEVFNGGLLVFAEVCLIVGLSVCWIAIFNVLGRQKLLRQRGSWKQPRQGWRRHSQSRKVSFKKKYVSDRQNSIDRYNLIFLVLGIFWLFFGGPMCGFRTYRAGGVSNCLFAWQVWRFSMGHIFQFVGCFLGIRKEWKLQFWINAWCDVMVTRGFQWWLASVCWGLFNCWAQCLLNCNLQCVGQAEALAATQQLKTTQARMKTTQPKQKS